MAFPNDFTPPTRLDDQPDLGDIKINHDVVASIVRLAALQVPGVAGVGGGLVDGISELFSKREADKRGVKVTEDAKGDYAVELRVVVTYGSEIGRTAYEVQVAVRKQIIAMTDKGVSRVDVIVEGVRLPSSGSSTSGDRSDDLWAGISTD
ncbi:MAG: Asp23/Gls24 family envelope stress response protein [Nibricoccus sp.]